MTRRPWRRGSLEDDTLGVAVQTVQVGVEAATTTTAPAAPVPSGVNAGDSGLAASASRPSMVLFAGIAGLAAPAGTTGAVSLARSRRDG